MRPARQFLFIGACALLLLSAARLARADIDYALANAGSQRPFSQLSDAIPTAWSLLSPQAVTGPTFGAPPANWLGRPANLSEPSLGNPNGVTLGQIVALGNPDGASRSVFGVYDRLAAVPIPVLLYFDNFSGRFFGTGPFGMPPRYWPLITGIPDGGSLSGSDSGGGTSASSALLLPPIEVVPVPEPTTAAMLLLPAALTLLARRKHR